MVCRKYSHRNNGLCADFAMVLADVPGAEIVGVYDADDLHNALVLIDIFRNHEKLNPVK